MYEIKIINFMRYRHIALATSLLLMALSLGVILVKGFNYGLDFTGGTLIEVTYEKAVKVDTVRDELDKAGFDGAIVQLFGEDTNVVIRLQRADSKKLAQEVMATLTAGGDKVSLNRVDFVGPQVGSDLKTQGFLGMILALAMVMIYIAMQFQFKFSVAAVFGLLHTTLITLGCFALFQWEFNLTVLAALLAMIGYSLNDTIIVSDRIRENFRLLRKGDPEHIIDLSITQTLSRTIVTSSSTLFVLFVLLYFGSDTIFGFCMMLIIGIVVGTYESIYVCTNVILIMKVSKEDLTIKSKDEKNYDTP